ncbi:MAG TPA: hypothetical protein VLH37_09775 [Bacteroidales bacterium]|nr:hypothetical protein [Bacteroidales bacterium]
MKKRLVVLLTLMFGLAGITINAYSSGGDTTGFTIRGYVRAMPSVMINREFSNADFSNMVHNRLDTRWSLPLGLSLVAEGRNRLIYNELLEGFPTMADLMDYDDGLVDLTRVWFSQGGWLGTWQIDRLFLDWQHSNWRVRVGRQRINWGINFVSNPNDLFNTYSFFDFDYPERPGADAVRIQYFTGGLSRIEAAYNPSRYARQSVAAMLYSTNLFNYDFQVIAGYFRHRAALGIGWAGAIGGAGFKGEATWFYHIENLPLRQRANLVAAIGFDYMFANGTFVLAEFLYNGGFTPAGGNIFMLTEPMRPDNIMFSEFAITFSASHAFSPVVNGGLSIMALPDQETLFFSPNLKYSLARNFDLEFVSQIFVGGQNTLFQEAGSSWFVALQYSF